MNEPLVIDGRSFTLRALNLGALQRIEPHLTNLQSFGGALPTKEALEAAIQVVYAGLYRADPTVTVDWVKDSVDMGNIGHIIERIFSVSGVQTQGEGKAVL